MQQGMQASYLISNGVCACTNILLCSVPTARLCAVRGKPFSESAKPKYVAQPVQPAETTAGHANRNTHLVRRQFIKGKGVVSTQTLRCRQSAHHSHLLQSRQHDRKFSLTVAMVIAPS
jgi:hypothetical protein